MGDITAISALLFRHKHINMRHCKIYLTQIHDRQSLSTELRRGGQVELGGSQRNIGGLTHNVTAKSPTTDIALKNIKLISPTT